MPTRPLTLIWLLASLLGSVQAKAVVEPVEWLLSQIRLGEVTHNEDLLGNSLYSLSLIEPQHPELLAAQARFALASGKLEEAEALLKRLGKLAPDSSLYRLGMLNLRINEPASRARLQQARQLANEGDLEGARACYRALFGGDEAPNLELAVEYAVLNDRIPAHRAEALAMMRELELRYPGHARLRATLAHRLLSSGHRDEGMALLHKMAASHPTRDSAARIWLADIRRMPVGPASLASLQQFIVTFAADSHSDEAQTLLAQQEELWASPAFRQRQAILARAADKRATLAELQRLQTSYPDDPEVMGVLGVAYARQHQREQANRLFERLLRHPDLPQRGRWERQWQNNRYWLILDRAKQAQASQQWEQAATLYRQVIGLNGSRPEAWLGLGDCELARHQHGAAEQAYLRALNIAPKNERARLRLFEFYREQDPERALALLSPGGSAALQKQGDRLRADLLERDAALLEQSGYRAQALNKRHLALGLTPEDPWRRYRTAVAMAAANDTAAASVLLQSALAANPQDSDLRYATALYLSGQGALSRARRILAEVPPQRRSSQMAQLDSRLARRELMAEAGARHDKGEVAAAERLLIPLLPDDSVALTLAGWAAARGDWSQAEHYYRGILSNDEDHQGARLGMAELALAQGDKAGSRHWLPVWSPSAAVGDDFNHYRRVANLYQQLGEPGVAREIFTAYAPTVAAGAPSQGSALFWRDAARQRFATGDTQGALALDRKALTAAGLAPAEPLDDAALTARALSRDQDDWLVGSVRRDLDRHYRQSQTTVSFDSDYWGSKGSEGTSDLQALTQMLQLDTPLAGGALFGRIERVAMDAGSFPDSPYRASFGTCTTRECWGNQSQQATGHTLAVGWKGDQWQADLGTTPLGFEVVDWVGGATVRGKWHEIGWRATLSRRPLNSSLLSYGGAVDPATGIRWGGIRANGVRLNLSHDQGGALGHWGSLQQHLLTGENVPDNWRTRLMGGSYYKLINEANRRVTIGGRVMAWHHEQDLSGYTLGRGGYYSPERYLSFGVPVRFSQRSGDWSWDLGGTLAWSRSHSDASRRYPLPGLLPDGLPDQDATVAGGSSRGTGYTVNALVEHRLTDHWRIGGRIDIQQADDYAPSHATLFLRYTFKPWRGDLDMPPLPLTPYGEFD